MIIKLCKYNSLFAFTWSSCFILTSFIREMNYIPLRLSCHTPLRTLTRALGTDWRRRWQPTPVLLPGKSHGWRNLVGYSPWGHKELDTTEQLHLGTDTFCFSFFPGSSRPAFLFPSHPSLVPTSLPPLLLCPLLPLFLAPFLFPLPSLSPTLPPVFLYQWGRVTLTTQQTPCHTPWLERRRGHISLLPRSAGSVRQTSA